MRGDLDHGGVQASANPGQIMAEDIGGDPSGVAWWGSATLQREALAPAHMYPVIRVLSLTRQPARPLRGLPPWHPLTSSAR